MYGNRRVHVAVHVGQLHRVLLLTAFGVVGIFQATLLNVNETK
jgi:hypothetical protein